MFVPHFFVVHKPTHGKLTTDPATPVASQRIFDRYRFKVLTKFMSRYGNEPGKYFVEIQRKFYRDPEITITKLS